MQNIADDFFLPKKTDCLARNLNIPANNAKNLNLVRHI